MSTKAAEYITICAKQSWCLSAYKCLLSGDLIVLNSLWYTEYVCMYVCVRVCVRARVCVYVYIYIYIYQTVNEAVNEATLLKCVFKNQGLT